MRVLVRADASTGIGSGHVMRQLALADALRRRGADVTFLMRSRPGDLHAVVEANGFRAVRLETADGGTALGVPLEDEIEQTAQFANKEPPYDVTVVDNYMLGSEWESAARAFSAFVFAVDDLANRVHSCDMLLDQNFGSENPARYRNLVPRRSRLLLGPAYALLREEFREFVSAPRERDGIVRAILVFLGGSDESGSTVKVLHALTRVQPKAAVRVVLPRDTPHAREVEELCCRAGYAYLGRVRDMAPLMQQADISIGAMGTAAWERCALGLPSIVVSTAENQRASAQACDAAGAVRWLGDASGVSEGRIAEELDALLSDTACVARMSVQARAVVNAANGFPTDRTAEALGDAACA